MNVPKFWKREEQSISAPGGRNFLLSCWGWSNKSWQDAKNMANEKLQRVSAKALTSAPLEQYPYGRSPLREETIESIEERQGEHAAIVTRNAYGALVLNTSKAMFMDIDLPKDASRSKGFQWLRKLMGKTDPPAPSAEDQILARIELWAQRQFSLTLRIYRTAAGFRCLITSHLHDPASAKTKELMEGLGCDPLYIRLCREQVSFRARLTPKPWRIKVNHPPWRWPFDNEKQERSFRKWQESYQRASSSYCVCRLIRVLGGGKILPEIAPVLEFHDRMCCSTENKPLA